MISPDLLATAMWVVLEVGAGVAGFMTGDRVASNGQHAEVVRMLGCKKIKIL